MMDDAEMWVDGTVGLVSSVFQPSLQMAWWLIRIGQILQWWLPLAIVAYMGVAWAAMDRIARGYKAIVEKEQKLLGEYKQILARIRTMAESIAFMDGGGRERTASGRRFDDLIAVVWKRLTLDLHFNSTSALFRETVPTALNWALRFAFSYYLGGSDADIVKDRAVQVSVNTELLSSACETCFANMSTIMTFQSEVAKHVGITARVAELDESLTELTSSESARSAGREKARHEGIELDGVDLVTPNGKCIASKLSLSVSGSHGLLVTGPTGCGKSTFLRVVSGLFPLQPRGTAQLSRPGGAKPGVKDFFWIPQRAYLAEGRLCDQLTYPVRLGEQLQAEEESQLGSLLKLAGLEYLVKRYSDAGGLLARTQWQVLSLGEQQRLGMCRLFYHRPSLGAMDECTSAVSRDAEEQLYAAARESGISCITLLQRPYLASYHQHELRLGEPTPQGWELRTVGVAETS
jgi:ABC-type uncharacterized transport system fused permease/ATPase subunit